VIAAGEAAERYGTAVEWLFGDDDFWEEPLEQTGVAAPLRRTMREVARRVAANPQELAAIEWRDLERVLFEVFDALGYRACLTRPAKDGAYDLRLEAEGYIYFVEVKHWSQSSKVGTGIINRFTEVVVENAGEGLLISTSGFTAKAVKGRLEISSYPVVLGSAFKVISLCRYYVRSESGLWVREGGLRDIFFEGAF
jgi:hypothetical protein